MDINQILNKVDHTQLAQAATFEDIKTLCDDAIKFNCASVCIPPSYVKSASEYVKGKIKICTVIGFPNGYNTTAVKCFETKNAIENGADEIDMVINIGLLKDKKYDEIEDEIKRIKTVCGEKLLKAIIETCLLTDEEKVKMCEIVSSAKADFIKTSTGFSTAGATREDIKLFAENVASHVAIKAAGGIANLGDANDMLALGATRLGTSRIVKLAKNEESNGY